MRATAGAFPRRNEITRMFAPALAAATLLALAAPSSWKLQISIVRDRLIAESPLIRTYGVNPYDYIFRLDYLEGRLSGVGTPAAGSAERADLDQEARLELKLDAELLVDLCPVFAAVDGIDESFYNDDARLPPDPVAFYVPKGDNKKRYALVVVLHGRRQTETDVVSLGALRALADRSHAILVAPWGTGNELWGKDAAAEIAAIVGEMERGFPIDSRRVYLAGVDLGGEGAFRIAQLYPATFRAVLSLNGALASGDAFSVAHTFHNEDVYLVGQDATYSLLAQNCVPVSYYSVDDARAGFYQTEPQVTQAWNDMFDGVIRNTNSRECTGL
jgi:pimeloyl-ACP methyl ester carboxylesterase